MNKHVYNQGFSGIKHYHQHQKEPLSLLVEQQF